MSLYRIPVRRLTTEAGEIDGARVEAIAQAEFAKRPWWPLERHREQQQDFAQFELENHARMALANVEWDAKKAAEQAQVEKIAADYSYDVERLAFEVQRRAFGSFTTTIDGSPERSALFERARKFAAERRQAERAQAGVAAAMVAE